MPYDPKTLKNNCAYRHDVEAAEAEYRKLLPKKTPTKEVKKVVPTTPSMYALLEKFKKR